MSEPAVLLESEKLCTAKASRTPGAILVVEDEPEILEPLCHTLKRAGYVVFAAEDGLTACRMIGSHRPDLVLLDIMLPDLDGWEVCRMLRQHPDPQVATTPVIILTALNSPEDKLHGLKLGADAYLPKPYTQQEVLLMSGRLIERHRREAALHCQNTQLNQVIEQQLDLHSLLFHELRNQLAILQINTELLQQTEPAAERARLAEVNRSSSYLQSLAEDFLLIRQLQGKALELPAEPLLANDFVDEVIKLYHPCALSRGITLKQQTVGSPRPFKANLPALKIILSALLDNAIKYGPVNRPVTVVCDFTARRFELKVLDEGERVPSEEYERIFGRFFRGSTSREICGSGLGLYGVRILANAMGGNAEIDDQYTRGNCFRVWIPLA